MSQFSSSNPFSNQRLMNFLGSPGESSWYYKDPNGFVQGPFSQIQMAQWFEHGYFADDLEIAFGKNSMFLPLHEYKHMHLKQSGLSPPQYYPPQHYPGYPQPRNDAFS